MGVIDEGRVGGWEGMGDCPRGLKTGLRLTGINSTDSVMYMEPMLSRTGVGMTMGWLYRLTWERMGT